MKPKKFREPTDREMIDGLLKQRNDLQRELRELRAKEAARRDPLVLSSQMVTVDIDNWTRPDGTHGPTWTWRNIYVIDAGVVPTHAETVMLALLATAEYPRGTRVRISIQSRSLAAQNTTLEVEGVVR